MNKRKQERLEDYKKKLDELRELERQPYRPTEESLRMVSTVNSQLFNNYNFHGFRVAHVF